MVTKRNIRVAGAGLSGWGRSVSPAFFDGVAPYAAYLFGRNATQEPGAEALGRRDRNLIFRGVGRPDAVGYMAGNDNNAIAPFSGVDLMARTGGFTIISVNAAPLGSNHNAVSTALIAGGQGVTLQIGSSSVTTTFALTGVGAEGASTGALPERGGAIFNASIVQPKLAKASVFKPGGEGPFTFQQALTGTANGGPNNFVIGSTPKANDFPTAVAARHYIDLFYDFALTDAQLKTVYTWAKQELAKDGVLI